MSAMDSVSDTRMVSTGGRLLDSNCARIPFKVPSALIVKRQHRWKNLFSKYEKESEQKSEEGILVVELHNPAKWAKADNDGTDTQTDSDLSWEERPKFRKTKKSVELWVNTHHLTVESSNQNPLSPYNETELNKSASNLKVQNGCMGSEEDNKFMFKKLEVSEDLFRENNVYKEILVNNTEEQPASKNEPAILSLEGGKNNYDDNNSKSLYCELLNVENERPEKGMILCLRDCIKSPSSNENCAKSHCKEIIKCREECMLQNCNKIPTVSKTKFRNNNNSKEVTFYEKLSSTEEAGTPTLTFSFEDKGKESSLFRKEHILENVDNNLLSGGMKVLCSDKEALIWKTENSVANVDQKCSFIEDNFIQSDKEALLSCENGISSLRLEKLQLVSNRETSLSGLEKNSENYNLKLVRINTRSNKSSVVSRTEGIKNDLCSSTISQKENHVFNDCKAPVFSPEMIIKNLNKNMTLDLESLLSNSGTKNNTEANSSAQNNLSSAYGSLSETKENVEKYDKSSSKKLAAIPSKELELRKVCDYQSLIIETKRGQRIADRKININSIGEISSVINENCDLKHRDYGNFPCSENEKYLCSSSNGIEQQRKFDMDASLRKENLLVKEVLWCPQDFKEIRTKDCLSQEKTHSPQFSNSLSDEDYVESSVDNSTVIIHPLLSTKYENDVSQIMKDLRNVNRNEVDTDDNLLLYDSTKRDKFPERSLNRKRFRTSSFSEQISKRHKLSSETIQNNQNYKHRKSVKRSNECTSQNLDTEDNQFSTAHSSMKILKQPLNKLQIQRMPDMHCLESEMERLLSSIIDDKKTPRHSDKPIDFGTRNITYSINDGHNLKKETASLTETPMGHDHCENEEMNMVVCSRNKIPTSITKESRRNCDNKMTVNVSVLQEAMDNSSGELHNEYKCSEFNDLPRNKILRNVQRNSFRENKILDRDESSGIGTTFTGSYKEFSENDNVSTNYSPSNDTRHQMKGEIMNIERRKERQYHLIASEFCEKEGFLASDTDSLSFYKTSKNSMFHSDKQKENNIASNNVYNEVLLKQKTISFVDKRTEVNNLNWDDINDDSIFPPTNSKTLSSNCDKASKSVVLKANRISNDKGICVSHGMLTRSKHFRPGIYETETAVSNMWDSDENCSSNIEDIFEEIVKKDGNTVLDNNHSFILRTKLTKSERKINGSKLNDNEQKMKSKSAESITDSSFCDKKVNDHINEECTPCNKLNRSSDVVFGKTANVRCSEDNQKRSPYFTAAKNNVSKEQSDLSSRKNVSNNNSDDGECTIIQTKGNSTIQEYKRRFRFVI